MKNLEIIVLNVGAGNLSLLYRTGYEGLSAQYSFPLMGFMLHCPIQLFIPVYLTLV
jgi:hypothetical protein